MKKLGFGLMRLPLTVQGDQRRIDQETFNKMVDCFIEQGFTYFDTAWPYHGEASERAFKKAVADRYPRTQFIIADKMPVWIVKEEADYKKIFDEQIERCGVEYFDYYLLHNLNATSYNETVRLGGFEFVKKMKAEGKVRNIGFSFHDKADVLDKILSEQRDLDFVQLQINYLDWDDNRVQSRKCYEVALKHNMPVIAMEPVKGSCLALVPEEAEKIFKTYNSSASAASWAIRFVASLDNIFMVLSGMSTFNQMVDNTGFMQIFKPLNNDEQALIKEAAKIIKSKIAIPCTDCKYCIETCPQNIPISRYFSLYNEQNQFGLLPSIIRDYGWASAGGGKASECIACKQCENHCPQHIAIVDNLKDFARIFEIKR